MRILILSASVGAGHVRAAQAVEAALRAVDSSSAVSTVEHWDILSYATSAFRKVYRDGYFKMVGRAPHLLGWLYDRTDRPFQPNRMEQRIERANVRPFLEAVRAFDPDLAVCTHFLPATLLERERRKGRIRARIATVVTDFEVHGLWLAAPSDHYFVATEEARAHLQALGVAPAAVTVSGIPTDPLFSVPRDRQAMREKHGWHPDLPALLVSAGGFGAGNGTRLVEALVAAELPAQIVAVCGKSAPLRAAIERAAAGRKEGSLPLVRAIGFTTEMHELMTAADLMIGKPGGLTTSESLIQGLGWVVVQPIPGQEEKNATYLLEQGVGIWCANLHTLAFKVRSVLEEPGRLAAMQANARRIARPHAAETVARWVVDAISPVPAPAFALETVACSI
jgi:processive 1,2-diacylglycerol beta-glucosyltransferase